QDDLGWLGGLEPEDAQLTLGQLAQRISTRLGREPLLIGDPQAPAGRIAWCTGAAQGFLADAVAAGANTYLSGEISEPTVHLARETGVADLACGHRASERYGVAALGQAAAEGFGIRHLFLDIGNPVWPQA